MFSGIASSGADYNLGVPSRLVSDCPYLLYNKDNGNLKVEYLWERINTVRLVTEAKGSYHGQRHAASLI